METVYCNSGILNWNEGAEGNHKVGRALLGHDKWDWVRKSAVVGCPHLQGGWVVVPGKFWQYGYSEVHCSPFLAPKGDFVGGHATLHVNLTRVQKRQHCLLPPLHHRKCVCSDKPDIGMFNDGRMPPKNCCCFEVPKVQTIDTLPPFLPVQLFPQKDQIMITLVKQNSILINFEMNKITPTNAWNSRWLAPGAGLLWKPCFLGLDCLVFRLHSIQLVHA